MPIGTAFHRGEDEGAGHSIQNSQFLIHMGPYPTRESDLIYMLKPLLHESKSDIC
jgi:hypothetical protein